MREAGPSLIQTTKGDLELVCVRADGTLQHWARADGTTWAWSPMASFASGCRTAPVMIEGQYGRADEFASGNYELVVALASGVLRALVARQRGSVAPQCELRHRHRAGARPRAGQLRVQPRGGRPQAGWTHAAFLARRHGMARRSDHWTCPLSSS
ncbi:hypothetical protein [Microbacterium elymi]|uniref:Uncharacterized protein n=1 Tax=Microbacterium elymi TaxID=2909587 RepID=A0ABY5NMU6_9MICO|nr:hypothetical protein [Microbacterium elymi]UUT36436.1 hypothetical protein L2X98_26335 [Microbacterium elymi]